MPTPLVRNEFNQTLTRDKSLIKIFGSYGGYTVDPSNPLNIPNLSSLVLIGGVNKITTMTTERGEAAEVRSLDYDNVDTIIERMPNLSTPKLTLSYVVTYAQTLAEAMGFGGFQVRYNTRPMLLSFVLPSPNPSTVPYKTILGRGAWLDGNPLEFDVDEKRDLRIVQNVNLSLAELFTL